jgi:hypothetical protein
LWQVHRRARALALRLGKLPRRRGLSSIVSARDCRALSKHIGASQTSSVCSSNASSTWPSS